MKKIYLKNYRKYHIKIIICNLHFLQILTLNKPEINLYNNFNSYHLNAHKSSDINRNGFIVRVD